MSLRSPAKDDVEEDGASEGKEKLFDGNCAKEGETEDGGKKARTVEDSAVSQQHEAEICCSDTDPRITTDEKPTDVRSVAFEASGGSWPGPEEHRKHRLGSQSSPFLSRPVVRR